MNKHQKAFYKAMKNHPCVENVRSKYGSERKVAIVKLKPVEVMVRETGRRLCEFRASIEIGLDEEGRMGVGKWVDLEGNHPHRLGDGMCLNMKFTEALEKGHYDYAIYDMVAALSTTDEYHASFRRW